jgi:hypothetical protein
MLEDVLRFCQLAEVCRDRAAKTRISMDAEAWLKLSEDWFELAGAHIPPAQWVMAIGADQIGASR